MARPFLYHVFDDPAFTGLAPLSAASINVVTFAPPATAARQMYSLKRDMDHIRGVGAGKGIVDAAVTKLTPATSGGRDLLALKIGTGTTHKVLLCGCHHAREWISVEMAYYIAEYLINTFKDPPTNDKEKRIKHLLTNRQIWVVPMVNPDGHVHTITQNRGWRPNRASHVLPAGSVVRAAVNGGTVHWPADTYQGVDINRNYETSNWGTETFDPGTPTDVKTSRDPRDGGEDSVWCGKSAKSEKETQAVDALIRAQGFRGVITFHSFGEQLLWPGPLTTGSGNAFVDWVGKGMVAIMGTAPSGHVYTYTGGPSPYLTTGDLADFAFEQSPGRPVYTPEVRPSNANLAHAFSKLPESEIGPCFNENLAATLALINCAGHNAAVANPALTTTTGLPPSKCQFVKHCWEVFRGWAP